MEHEVESEHIGGGDSSRVGNLGEEGALLRFAQTGNRGEVDMRIEHEPLLVDPPVEVDRQLGHPGDRAIDPDQHLPDPVAGTDGQATGASEVPVQPGVEEGAAVDLDAELSHPVCGSVRVRREAEVGAVGVRHQHPEPRGTPGPGDPGKEASGRLQVAGSWTVIGGSLSEPGSLESGDSRGHGVEGGGGGVDEGAEVLCTVG